MTQPNLFCQRWRDKRGVYEPVGETIRTSEYEVAPINRVDAKAFVLQHHYSGSFTSNRFRYGASEPPSNDLRAWFDFWLAELTRPMKHPGNHKYAWSLDRRKVFSLYTYPKRD